MSPIDKCPKHAATQRLRRPSDLPQDLADAVSALGITYEDIALSYSRATQREFPVRTNFITQVVNGHCACPALLRRIIKQRVNTARARAVLAATTVQSTPEESARQ
ncbi:MAG TPA: hypothetical protein VMY35_08205 [Phycisphaerae bacterium]|nr:hypothetical protein [Phycisphaerae bacterium]